MMPAIDPRERHAAQLGRRRARSSRKWVRGRDVESMIRDLNRHRYVREERKLSEVGERSGMPEALRPACLPASREIREKLLAVPHLQNLSLDNVRRRLVVSRSAGAYPQAQIVLCRFRKRQK